MIAPQGLKIEENLVLKYEETHNATKPTRSKKSNNNYQVELSIFREPNLSCLHYDQLNQEFGQGVPG